jgi:iron complex outermembrane receptor protein
MTNKVLVLIDGREFYSSVFTGANWDITDVIFDDIDRIEVIRGASATLWGANTLNGVINIITKEAKYTQGNLVSIIYGNQEKGSEYRYGGNNGSNIFYRLYAKRTKREDLKSIDNLRGEQYQNARDGWLMSKAGFRVDWQKTLKDEITIQGDLHEGTRNQALFIPTIEGSTIHDQENINGFNLDAKWSHNINSTDSLILHSYIDNTSRKSLLGSLNKEVLNFDAEYHLKAGENNKLKMGLGYRYTQDSLKNGLVNNILVNEFSPNDQSSNLYNAFIQDTYSIIPQKLDFTFGSKFEHHYITGKHYMPSAQLRWTPNDENTLWASVSKGIREPSRLETSLRRLVANLGPYKIYWQSNSDFKAEEMVSYEAGYRNRSLAKIELDVSVFRNEYDNVRTFEPNFAKL